MDSPPLRPSPFRAQLEEQNPGHWTEVDCPHCENRNREARRRCKRFGGMCKGNGRVWKSVPDAIDPPRKTKARRS